MEDRVELEGWDWQWEENNGEVNEQWYAETIPVVTNIILRATKECLI